MKGWLVAAIVGAAAQAAGGPLDEALQRHGAADIASLRARPADPSARCTLGAIYAKVGDLPRASLFLDGCDDAALDPDIADAVARATREVRRALQASELSAISIHSDPPGLAVETDALPGESMATPATVWARAGTYHVTGGGVTATLRLAAHSSASVVLDHRAPGAPPPPKPRAVDFSDEPTDAPTTGPPPAQKHPSLLPCKYEGCDTHGGETLEDPFAAKAERVPLEPPARSLGVRAGTSAAFHDGGSRIAPALAVDGRIRAGRVPGLGPAAVDVRLDWSRRGGDDGEFDAFGASAQYGVVLFAPRAEWLSGFVGARGELRTADMVAALPVHRAGLGYTAALELALRSLPVTLGLRYDEDLTPLVPGIRERALLIELGLDLRDGVH